jgi:MFS family permease
MGTLLRDTRVQRLLVANVTGSIGSGITLIAVPWMLVHRPDGDQLYGWVTAGTTLVLFLVMPYYGAWLDRHSRKTMLLASELFGCVGTLTMAAWAFCTGHVAAWQLVVSYFCGMMYYTLHYPAKFAFLQQIFTPEHYQPLMGLLEIQGQAAMMIAGGLGSVLVDRVPLALILLIDSGTYFFSFCVQSTLPYEATHVTGKHAPPANAWRAMGDGWRWLRERPQLSLFFACTLVPFIVVMVCNYLFPIYVKDILHAPAAVYGGGEITFAIGAMLAGALMPQLASRRGADLAIMLAHGACIVAILGIVVVHAELPYYVAAMMFGFGNAGTRVARNALMFHAVPNAVMGRVSMFFSVYDRLLRTALTSLATVIVMHGSATLGFVVLLVVLVIAYAGAFSSRQTVANVTPLAATSA